MTSKAKSPAPPPEAPLGAHGLPELPAGYFWRVKTRWSEYGGEYTVVSIRRERRIGSKEVAYGHIYKLWDQDFERRAVSAADIREVAARVLKSWLAEAATGSYDGDYPPKRLEA